MGGRVLPRLDLRPRGAGYRPRLRVLPRLRSGRLRVVRFLAEDPIGFRGGINFYRYVGSDPVYNTDPMGLKVYRCCRPVQTGKPLFDIPANASGYKHCFLKTDTLEGGMGPANGGPLPACPLGIPTAVVSHPGQSAGAKCTELPDVDEGCVNRELMMEGKPLGGWMPWNQCNSYVDEVTISCTKRCGPAPVPLPGPGRTPTPTPR
jgi:hypothetical protein